MPTQTEIAAKIAEIDAILDDGIDSVTIDGNTTHYDFAELRRRRAELYKLHTASQAEGKARRNIRRISF